MSSCVSVPTGTLFATQFFTSQSLSTSFSTSVSTSPPTTTTTTSTTCLDPKPNPTCSSTSIIVSTITQPGSTTTISVPVTITIPVTQSSLNPTATLFSTSCSPFTTTTPSSSIVSTFSSLPPSTSSSTDGSSSAVLTTSIFTSSVPPSSSASVSSSTPALNGGGENTTSGKIGPIVGGVVGGLLALLAVIGGIWFVWRKSNKWRDIYENEEEKEHRRMSLGEEDVQPKPYHYGLVGQSPSPVPYGGSSSRFGHSPSNSISMIDHAARGHSRSSSSGQFGSFSRESSERGAVHTRPNLSQSSSASTVPLLERAVIAARPGTAPSVSGPESPKHVGTWAATSSRRPQSANASLPAGAAAAVIRGAATTSSSSSSSAAVNAHSSPWPSSAEEKRRLAAASGDLGPLSANASLPGGAAALASSSSSSSPQAAANTLASSPWPFAADEKGRQPNSLPRGAAAPVPSPFTIPESDASLPLARVSGSGGDGGNSGEHVELMQITPTPPPRSPRRPPPQPSSPAAKAASMPVDVQVSSSAPSGGSNDYSRNEDQPPAYSAT